MAYLLPRAIIVLIAWGLTCGLIRKFWPDADPVIFFVAGASLGRCGNSVLRLSAPAQARHRRSQPPALQPRPQRRLSHRQALIGEPLVCAGGAGIKPRRRRGSTRGRDRHRPRSRWPSRRPYPRA